MKRLLKISLDTLLTSLTPIVSWFTLSLLVDTNLINVFLLVYPLQFICGMMKSIFSTGANICQEKEKNKNIVLSAMTTGIIIGAVLFWLLIYYVEYYIGFMHMDIAVYKTFTIYAIAQLFLQLVLSFLLNKLYFEEKNTLANKFSISFNILNFIILIGSSLIFKEQLHIVMTTLLIMFWFTTILTIKSYNKFSYIINFKNLIKYDSVDLFNNLTFFLIFLFWLSNTFEYGAVYTLAITFLTLITDTQWDIFDGIGTVATIDIAKESFNYKIHKKNAYYLLLLLVISMAIMFAILFPQYQLNLRITLIFLTLEMINFLLYPLYKIKTRYLQIEYSPIKTTTNKIISNIGRLGFSFLKTPYCTGFWQIFSSVYQFISINIMFNRNFIIDKKGFIQKRGK